jgi:hypothetical protein
MSSGIGLVMVAAAVARTILDPVDRRRFVATIPPIVVYGAWFLAFGRGGVRSGSLSGPVELVAFLRRGMRARGRRDERACLRAVRWRPRAGGLRRCGAR